MPIRVEFYGVVRLRAGVASAEVEAGPTPSLGGVLAALRLRFPELAEHCFVGAELHPTLVANLNGDAFLRDLAAPLKSDDVILLLSTDAGG